MALIKETPVQQEFLVELMPAGINSDVVETNLGVQHQDVHNFRLNKHGEWQTVRGYVASKTGLTAVKAAIEVTEDVSGARFILFQQGAGFYRMDHDDGDGDGYENETPYEVPLPSGVTIGNDVYCKFYKFRGVVRIAGPSVPLWYGYKGASINSQTDLPAYLQVDVDNFEATTESWSSSSATVARTTAQKYQGAYSLLITQTGTSGTGRKSKSTTIGRQYRAKAWYYRTSDGFSQATRLAVGTTAGAIDLGFDDSTTKLAWTYLEVTFTATGTTTYFSVCPVLNQSIGFVYLDLFVLEELHDYNFDNWLLCKAEPSDWITYTVETESKTMPWASGGEPTYHNYYYAISFIFDHGQYSLPIPLETSDRFSTIDYKGFARSFTVKINETHFIDTDAAGVRLTGVMFLCFESQDAYDPNDPTIPWTIQSVIDIADDAEDMNDVQMVHLDLPLFSYGADTYTPSNAVDINLAKRRTIQDTFDLTDADEAQEYAEHLVNYLWVQPSMRCRLAIAGNVMDTWIKEEGAYMGSPSGTALYTVEFYFEDDLRGRTGKVDLGSGTASHVRISLFLEPYTMIDWVTFDRYLCFHAAIDLYDLAATTYHGYTGIPLGTKKIGLNYNHFAVVDGRAYVSSQETDETDMLRYSVENQFDVFPDTYLIPTEVGDADDVKAVVNRDGRIVVLKQNTLSQMQYVSESNFHTDIGLANSGLYPADGWIVIDHVLYYMDVDEIYAFTGAQPIPLLAKENNRLFYKDYVGEDSYILYNPKDREIWFILTGIILVYQMDRGQFHTRSKPTNILQGFIDFEKNLWIIGVSWFGRINHDETTFTENVAGYIKSELIDIQQPGTWKKIKEFAVYGKGNKAVDVDIADPRITAADSETLTLDADEVDMARFRPKYLMKGAEIEITTESAVNTDVTIRKMETRIHRFAR